MRKRDRGVKGEVLSARRKPRVERDGRRKRLETGDQSRESDEFETITWYESATSIPIYQQLSISGKGPQYFIRNWVLLFVFAISFNTATAQKIIPLNMGDKVPDIKISNILNYPKSTIQLADLKGKLVILDFFATWCIPCVRKMGELDSLQEVFKDHLQVIAVCPKTSIDTRARLKDFIEQRSKTPREALHVPVVAEDTVLSKYFIYKFIPHYVWINSSGIVIAVTGPDELTAENIQTAIRNNNINLEVKRDRLEYNPNNYLLENGNGGEIKNMVYRSIWANFLPGMGSGVRKMKDSVKQKIAYVNNSVADMYLLTQHHAPNRYIIDLPDSQYTLLFKTLYNYELSVPISISETQLHQIQLEDLNRYSGYTGRMEKRKLHCYSIVCLKEGSGKELAAKPGKPHIDRNRQLEQRTYHGFTFTKITRDMNSGKMGEKSYLIITDETGIPYPVDLLLPNRAFEGDTKALKTALETQGLSLVESEKELDVFVITAQSTGHQN
jgi:thiol-disulfide isomerase/thioredoxin